MDAALLPLVVEARDELVHGQDQRVHRDGRDVELARESARSWSASDRRATCHRPYRTTGSFMNETTQRNRKVTASKPTTDVQLLSGPHKFQFLVSHVRIGAE